jgi:5-methylcytosine-specific restriction endonuclease McrA
LCGKPTHSKYGACFRAGDCRREYNRRESLAHEGRDNACGRAWRQANPERVKANHMAWNEANKDKLREYMRAYGQQWRATHPGATAEAVRKWEKSEHGRNVRRAYIQRTDRPCRYRYAKECSDLAVPGSKYCRVHAAADAMRRWRRKRTRLSTKLREAQHGICPWCDGSLPADLTETHLDHIIPRARGGPDLEWNLQLLHDKCNLSKHTKITPHALILAAEHGITLTIAS